MSRVLIVLVGVLVLLFGACQLLPERFAASPDIIVHSLFGRDHDTPVEETVQSRIRAPEGFEAHVWATDVPGARFLAVTARGDVLVSLPRRGRVVAIEVGPNGEALPARDLLTDLDRPHGLEVTDNFLYVGEGSAIARVAFRAFGEGAPAVDGPVERIVTGLPNGGNHWTRTVRMGPDGRLYIGVGSSCNVCEEEDPRRAAILVAEADGSGLRTFATGLRNPVGFDWQPGTDDLYATDNGRDLLGDDFPPCELDRVVDGGFYGWPYANGANVPDPDFGAGNEDRIASAIPPAHPFPAHNAPLGITFVKGVNAPAAYRGAALVALHGSWNRTEKDGYEVVSLHWAPDGSIESREFLTGFERDGDVIGRPVDVAETPDGAILISDDYAGVLWRVTPTGTGTGASASAPPPPPTRTVATATIPVSPEVDAMGAALFEEHDCGRCHLPERAEPGIVIKPLVSLGQRFDTASLAAYFVAPTPPMPAFPLDAGQREALAAHVLQRFGE